MHPTPLILLALGAVALAHPTTNITTDAPLLEKRSSRPWVDSYAPDNGSCKVGDFATSVYGRPFIQAGDCVAWCSIRVCSRLRKTCIVFMLMNLLARPVLGCVLDLIWTLWRPAGMASAEGAETRLIKH